MQKMYAFFLCFLLILGTVPGFALAQKNLTIVSTIYYPVSLAVAYKDMNAGWVVEGWWDIPAQGQRTLRLNTRHKDIFIYAQNLEHNRFWHGNEHNPKDRTFTVVDDAFKYILGSTPYGTPKKVRFVRLDTEHYTHYKHTLNY